MLSVVNADATAVDGSPLIDEIVREGARHMPAAAPEAEVKAYVSELADQQDETTGSPDVCCNKASDGSATHAVPRLVRPTVSVSVSARRP